MPRHRHAQAYVAIILSGGYLEAGDDGRHRVVAGDALVHTPFDSHLDLIGSRGAEVLNLPLARDKMLPAAFRVADPDALARAAETDIHSASAMLDVLEQKIPLLDDWPDLLALALRGRCETRLGQWAIDNGLAPATVSRGFRQVYGVSPARYRGDARARRALSALITGRTPMADLATAEGFADQAHLSRAINRFTGATPTVWRSKVKFVQDNDA